MGAWEVEGDWGGESGKEKCDQGRWERREVHSGMSTAAAATAVPPCVQQDIDGRQEREKALELSKTKE